MILRKIFLIVCMVMVTLTGFAQASDNTFVSSKYKCSIQAPENWELDTSKRGVLVAFNYVDGVSSVTLRAYTMSETPTVNGLAERMAESAYDGWIKVGGRYGKENDIFITGADNKYEAVYKEVSLNEKGQKITTIAAEEYYVRGKNAYIVTAKTTGFHFPVVRKDIRKIMRSFYIDDNL